MSKEIAVRLPDGPVDFLDELVASGDDASRASIVTRALKSEKRRLGTLKDVEILTRLGEDPELVEFAEHSSRSIRARVMRPIHLAGTDELRPVVILTREEV